MKERQDPEEYDFTPEEQEIVDFWDKTLLGCNRPNLENDNRDTRKLQ